MGKGLLFTSHFKSVISQSINNLQLPISLATWKTSNAITEALYDEFTLEAGKGYNEAYCLSNIYSMTNIYFKFHIFLPKRFGATQVSVCCPFPGTENCYPSLTQAVTSQVGHIKLAF